MTDVVSGFCETVELRISTRNDTLRTLQTRVIMRGSCMTASSGCDFPYSQDFVQWLIKLYVKAFLCSVGRSLGVESRKTRYLFRK